MTTTRTPRRPKPPITVRVVAPEGAPRTEEEWTPEQEASAIRGLGVILGILAKAPAVTPADAEAKDAA